MEDKRRGRRPRKRGPKPDGRPLVKFKVEPAVYETLAELQPANGMKPDAIAGLILHIVINDPDNAVARLRALLAPAPPAVARAAATDTKSAAVLDLGAERRRATNAKPGD